MHSAVRPLIVMGFGNMGRAIVRGALAAGAIEPAGVLVIDPSRAALDAARALGLRAQEDPLAAMDAVGSVGWDRLLLAIKPQMLDVLSGAVALATPRLEIISILAGTPIARLRAVLGRDHSYVRVMPNLPASVGKGITAVSVDPGTDPSAVESAARLFESVGAVVRIDESLMDAFTAVSGSGPAYVFRLAEAMAEGATRVGFDPVTANEIVLRTIAGAAALMERDARAFKELRSSVTSPGGTTAAAIAELERAGFVEAVARAIVAARDRGRELGQS